MIETIAYMCPDTHLYLLGDPFQRHAGFGPQSLGHPDLARVALGVPGQVSLRPAEFVELFAQDAARFVFIAFVAQAGVMTFPGQPLSPVEQILAKRFSPETPAPADGLIGFPFLLPPELFEVPLQLLPPGGVVPADVMFPQ